MKQEIIEIKKIINKFYDSIHEMPNHRDRSWEHCYRYFGKNNSKFDEDTASLHLAFYLASWGMYRGSSFLLQRDYKFLKPIIPILKSSAVSINDKNYAEEILSLREKIREKLAYIDEKTGKERWATDTLVTKIILGTLGIVPAYDYYFIEGLRKSDLKITSSFGQQSLQEIQQFVKNHETDLKSIQQDIQQKGGILYPFMKLIDMCFWQIGYDKK